MMSAVTPRRSMRLVHTHTPKMSERKKSLFVPETPPKQESLTKHRRLSVVDSEEDSDDCDLGIISTLDSSSCDEDQSKTPEKFVRRETRSQSRRLNQSTDLKNFMKSPFTLKKYQTRYSCPEKNLSSSTPVTPHFQTHPGTPSSTHSCTSVHTTSSTSSRARKSLASLIADTESCSSSLKDLNFDSDSSSGSKENTPSKSIKRSIQVQKMTPKMQSFKGILLEQRKNITPLKNAVVLVTPMDFNTLMSPSHTMTTPHNTTEAKASPPKISHRKSGIAIQESPDSSCNSEKSHKRLNYDDKTDTGPVCKYPRLDLTTAPKARFSLITSEFFKENLSTKSFYGKTNPELTPSISKTLTHAIQATIISKYRPFNSHTKRHRRKPGQINRGVRHNIRKPKALMKQIVAKHNMRMNKTLVYDTALSTIHGESTSQDISQEMEHDKIDPFHKENQTIEALLSHWTEEDVPESELGPRKELSCFNSKVMEETNAIFQPVTAVPVNSLLPQDEPVILELGGGVSQKTDLQQNSVKLHQNIGSQQSNDIVMGINDVVSDAVTPGGEFIPVEGGYIVVDGMVVHAQQEIPDLDEIEREIQMLDEKILLMAETNNINAKAVLASTEKLATEPTIEKEQTKLFPIFTNPNPGISTDLPKDIPEKKKKFIKTGIDQYQIDAGQKKFGATQCPECDVIYQIGDPLDEHDHMVHHNASDVLKFNGWKDEYLVEKAATSRIIRVRGGDMGWKKVLSLLNRVVHPQLGYVSDLPGEVHAYTAYLFIEKKQIVGCLVVEPKSRAYKLLPGEPDCCSVEEYPVKCGVSRIWTHPNYRRRGVAVRMLECARASFLYGIALTRQEVAFSSPTPSGKAFATKYCGTENFYVYLN